MIFDINMEDFRRNARYVTGGHVTVAPPTLTYVSVVLQESFRIDFTLAALNDLEVKTSDIHNACFTAPFLEKIWTTLGSEFGPDLARKQALVVIVLCGLNSAGASFKNYLSDYMINLGYLLCLEDPDLCFKEETCPSDCAKYYVYLLIYVDDCLVIDHATDTSLH